jgi:hypothetical protein
VTTYWLPKLGHRTGQHGLAAHTLTKIARQVGGQPLARRASHEAESLLHAGLRHDAQERRLFQVHSQRLLQSSIEHGIARGVDEIGHHYGIFLAQGRASA